MTDTISGRIAAALLGPGGVAAWHRTIAGDDPELDLVILKLSLTARQYVTSAHRSMQPAPRATDTPDARLVSTREAAATLGRHRTTITRAVARGDLPAQWVGGHLALRVADIENYAEQRAA